MSPSLVLAPPRPRVKVRNYLRHINRAETIEELRKGLTSEQKYISSKFFYDAHGSQLFEEITRLPEYYPTRTEKKLILKAGEDIGPALQESDIVEIGSGGPSKISLLLDQISPQVRETIRYMPFDVSQSMMEESAEVLLSRFPELEIQGIVADFMSQLLLIPNERPRLFCFFGSTLGNLTREEAFAFLSDMGKIMRRGDHFLIGFDMVKDKRVLEEAYNDSQNITAAFNRNILNVVNRHLGSGFASELFDHRAFYNEHFDRIEMHLKSREYMSISTGKFQENIFLRKGETIHTENSHKFRLDHLFSLSAAGGLRIKNIYTDQKKWFSLALLSVPE